MFKLRAIDKAEKPGGRSLLSCAHPWLGSGRQMLGLMPDRLRARQQLLQVGRRQRPVQDTRLQLPPHLLLQLLHPAQQQVVQPTSLELVLDMGVGTGSVIPRLHSPFCCLYWRHEVDAGIESGEVSWARRRQTW